MSPKKLMMGGFFLGSTIGGLLPGMWGDDSFLSVAGFVCSTLGGVAGIWVGYRISRSL